MFGIPAEKLVDAQHVERMGANASQQRKNKELQRLLDQHATNMWMIPLNMLSQKQNTHLRGNEMGSLDQSFRIQMARPKKP